MKRRVPRQAQRYPAKLAVTNLNGRPVTDTFLMDISALGAKLESSTPLARRYPVEINILFPGAQTETKLAGMVVWMRPSVASPGRYLMGVKFHQRFWDLDQLGRAGKI
ncbi:MAG: PilZ domain-containing protein [Deltaproteobacteria bacterium]|nr:PilZ domain-containing protein [Deltaproteobacteria bacterium]MBI4794267.1 PilZ domain-containing protein [Deltaproteobacteria bacterium]